ncbi:recombinase family protein [Streptomyces sp. P9(2023)]|uniref:recombinase family protein n=1 Tax=Streptomyces sp. P9(2023) TaxID=3064394 RepID=UPI0028F3FC7D|nr:recombinase family protein [Streptomyces sp. P9(2023)]MDT9692152.1 recombinase family protein [Streptomyces sp. P9(2023)]
MDQQTVRAAVYTRLSRDSDGSTSIASQVADCRLLCDARGWEVVVEAADVDVSGSVAAYGRPGLNRLLGELDRWDVLVVAQPDRLARSTIVAVDLLSSLEAEGKSLVTARDALDTATPDGRRRFLAAIVEAQAESGLIQARIARSRLSLRQAERWIGGNAPYGYQIIEDGNGGKRLALCEKSAERMRWIVNQVLEGETVTSVCRTLNTVGVPSPGTVSSRRGKVSDWSPTVLRRMLQSPSLLGHRTTGSGRERRAVTDTSGQPVRVGPALIDTGTWERLQATLTARRSATQRPRLRSSLLLHVAHCSECGAPLHYNSRRLMHGGNSNDVYRCPEGCKVLVCAVRIETAVEQSVMSEFAEIPFIARFPYDIGQSDDHDRAQQLRNEIRELAGRLAVLRGTAADAVQAELESRSSLLDALESTPHARWEWVPTGKSVKQEWESRGVGGRRQILLDLGVHVVVSPADNQRTWNPARVRISSSGPGTLLARGHQLTATPAGPATRLSFTDRPHTLDLRRAHDAQGSSANWPQGVGHVGDLAAMPPTDAG